MHIVPLVHRANAPEGEKTDTVNGILFTVAVKVIPSHFFTEAIPHGVECFRVFFGLPCLVAVCGRVVYDTHVAHGIVTCKIFVIKNLFCSLEKSNRMLVVVSALLPCLKLCASLCRVEDPNLFTGKLSPTVSETAIHTINTSSCCNKSINA